MELRLLAEEMITDNATFQLLMRRFHAPRFLQVGNIQFFFKVMAVLLLVDGMVMDNVTFHL